VVVAEAVALAVELVSVEAKDIILVGLHSGSPRLKSQAALLNSAKI
jgi:hypothetical protein